MPQEVLGFDVASVSLLPSALLVSSFISARWRSLACSPFPLALQLYLPCLSVRSWLPGMPSPLCPALSRTNCRSPPQVASSLFVASITRRRAEESRVQGWSSGRLSSWGPEILEGNQIRFFIMKWGESKTTRKKALPSLAGLFAFLSSPVLSSLFLPSFHGRLPLTPVLVVYSTSWLGAAKEGPYLARKERKHYGARRGAAGRRLS